MKKSKENLRKVYLACAVLSLLSAMSMRGSADVAGDRPLLVILVEFQNRSFADALYMNNYKVRIFGPAEPNVTEYYRETSHGRFTYVAAIRGETYGRADGMVRVLMNVRQDQAPTGRDFRNLALSLANQFFDYSRYDANGDGRIQDRELTVLAIQANGGNSGKTMTAGNVNYDGVSLNGLPVPVMSENAQNYVLYHELAHAVDLNGWTGKDLYNLRDGFRQKAITWNVAADGAIASAGSEKGEIALELDANWFSVGAAITAYRDQNGELRLAGYDLSAPDNPQLKKMASAGLAEDLSVSQVGPLRLVTALRSGGGNLKLIVWDVNFNWEFIRRGDYTAGEASDIEVRALSSSRVVVACRDADGNLKMIAFDISQNGELTRRGSYTGGAARGINLANINSSRVVAAVRQVDGNLKVICFDLNLNGEFTRRGDWETGFVTDVDLARISLRRVAVSVRDGSGNLKVILFEVNADGDVTRQGSWQSSAVCDRDIQCNGSSAPLPTDLVAKTSIVGLAQSRLAVSWIDPTKNIQVRALDIQDEGASLEQVGSRATEGEYVSSRLVRVSDTAFTTFGQVDGQIWTGSSLGLLGGHTGNDVVHFDPYTKLKLGWLPYVEIEASTPMGLAPMGTPAAQAVILRVPGHRETEYFILEVRKRESIYEAGLADEGLAIWRVDETKTYPHPYVSLEWLGGARQSALWNDTDIGLTRYDDSSSPAGSRWSDFSPSGVSIKQVESFFRGLSFEITIR